MPAKIFSSKLRRNKSSGSISSLEAEVFEQQHQRSKCGGWLPRRGGRLQQIRRRFRRSSLDSLDDGVVEKDDNNCLDERTETLEYSGCNGLSSFQLSECPRCDYDAVTCQDSGSALTTEEEEDEEDEVCGSGSVRFNLSRTVYRVDTKRNMNCSMEHYDCWYNSTSISQFKMEQKQVTEELFEEETSPFYGDDANENNNEETKDASTTVQWRQTLQDVFREYQEQQQKQQQQSSIDPASEMLIQDNDVSSSSSLVPPLDCVIRLEELYAKEDGSTGNLFTGLEFDSLARMRGFRPHVHTRDMVRNVLRQATCPFAAAREIAHCNEPTCRLAQTIALAQAKALLR